LYVTVELETKLLPLIVKVCAAAPAATELGDSDNMTGTGLFTVKLTELDAPPPGLGFVTTTGNTPPVAKSPALRDIVNCVELRKVAGCATLLYVTVELETKLLPLIVKVCTAALAATELGDSDNMTGTGLFTVKLTELDAPPPGAGFVTTIGKAPATAWSATLRVMVS